MSSFSARKHGKIKYVEGGGVHNVNMTALVNSFFLVLFVSLVLEHAKFG